MGEGRQGGREVTVMVGPAVARMGARSAVTGGRVLRTIVSVADRPHGQCTQAQLQWPVYTGSTAMASVALAHLPQRMGGPLHPRTAIPHTTGADRTPTPGWAVLGSKAHDQGHRTRVGG